MNKFSIIIIISAQRKHFNTWISYQHSIAELLKLQRCKSPWNYCDRRSVLFSCVSFEMTNHFLKLHWVPLSVIQSYLGLYFQLIGKWVDQWLRLGITGLLHSVLLLAMTLAMSLEGVKVKSILSPNESESNEKGLHLS